MAPRGCSTVAFFTATMILSSLAASAAEVTLQWDPNTETDLAGYRLFQADHSLLSTTPAQAVADAAIVKTTIADAKTATLTVTGLAARTLYYFRLTALNTSSYQSDFNVDANGHPAEVMVYLADNNVAQAAVKFLSPALVDGKNDAAYFNPPASEVVIWDVNGRQVFHKTRADFGNGAITWNCQDDAGKLLPSGVYIAKIKRSDGKVEFQSFAIVK